jgi:hypothetical protein
MRIKPMAWMPRIPELRTSLGLFDGEFGLLLSSLGFKAVIGDQLLGRLIQKLCCWSLLRIAQLSMPLGVTMMGPTETGRRLRFS